MNELKDKINLFFSTYKKEIKVNKLLSLLKIKEDEYNALLDVLYELEKEGKIYCLEDDKYIHIPPDFYLYHGTIQSSAKNKYYLNLKKGLIINIPNKNLNGAKENDVVYVEVNKSSKHNKQLIGNVVRVVKIPKVLDEKVIVKAIIKKDYVKNNYFVTVDEKNIPITLKDLNGAYVDDLVSIQITSGLNSKGKVVDIIKRHNCQHVLQYKKIDGKKRWVSIINNNYVYDVDTKEDFEINDNILVRLDENNNATFIKKIDRSNDLTSYIKTLMCDLGFYTELSEKSKEEISKINHTITLEEIKNRVDLRNLMTVTIDGDNSKDLDDAISLEYKDGKYYLYVHIADVSHYVKFNSALFKDAAKKGTSLYPANLVFHMLAEELSNGVCSLNQGEEKLAKTCLIELDKEGNVLDYSIFRSVIRSNCKMSYSKVDKLLTSSTVTEEYKPYVNMLFDMNILSNILQKKRIERGAINFESDEIEFDINNNGHVEGIKNRTEGPSHLIIENFMLIANECISQLAKYYDVPFIFRNHECPTINQTSKLKENLKFNRSYLRLLNHLENPKILQRILTNICDGKDKIESMYFSKLMLECMNRAYYDTYSIGHYALALDSYATITSPIRRLPDLLNHYILDKIIDGDINNLDYYEREYKKLCPNCNTTRMAAEKLEHDINLVLLKDYISNYVGETLSATIIFISDDKIGIKTKDFLYGNIEIPKSCIIENNVSIDGKIYEIGDSIEVTIDGVKDNASEVLFSIKRKEKQKIKKEGIK